jgi:AraC-like DNA-binding protein
MQTRVQTSRILIIPRAPLGAAEDSLDRLHGLCLRPGGVTHGLLAAHLAAVWARRETLTEDEAGPVAQVTLTLVRELLIRPSPDRWAADRRHEAVTARMMRHIRENLGDPDLGPDLLCRRFGVSRAVLYRAFAPLGGVAAHIRNRRLKQAFVALTAPEPALPLGPLAASLGFASAGAFRLAFRRRYGLGPGEVRERGLSALADSAPAFDRPYMTIPSWVGLVRGT